MFLDALRSFFRPRPASEPVAAPTPEAVIVPPLAEVVPAPVPIEPAPTSPTLAPTLTPAQRLRLAVARNKIAAFDAQQRKTETARKASAPPVKFIPAPEPAPGSVVIPKMNTQSYTIYPAGFDYPVVDVVGMVVDYWVRNVRYAQDHNPEHETALIFFLNAQKKIQGVLRIQGDDGSVDVMMPVWIKARSLVPAPVAIVLSHSHPKGGSVEPSQGDIEVTKKLRSILGASKIEVLDHVIVGTEGVFCSMRQACPLWSMNL